MTKLYSWVRSTSEDLENYKSGRFTYSFRGQASGKAFWVFDLRKPYRPGIGISKGRLLVAFDFGTQLQSVIENKIYYLNFESGEFEGEAKHKDRIIVKNNEPGAYGIGAFFINLLSPKITLASKAEVAKALGKSDKEINNQKW